MKGGLNGHARAGDVQSRRTADVIVIGGGLQGCSTALHLAMRGIKTIVLERDHVGRHASAANAGAARLIGRHIAELELAVASADIWRNLTDLTGSDGGFREVGHLFVAETEEELIALRERRDRVLKLGYTFEDLVSAEDVRKAVPGIASHVVGGLVNWSDGYANPFETIRAFRDRAVALGVRIRNGTKVLNCARSGESWRLETTDGDFTAKHIVNCAGFGGANVAEMFGDRVEISVEAPMMMVTTPVPRYDGPVLGRVKGRLSLKASSNGSILIGGGHRARYRPELGAVGVDLAGLIKSARTLKELLPELVLGRLQRAWYGLEAYTVDGLPVLCRSSNADGVIHAFGFSGHGFQLGPAVGRVISDLIVDGTTSIDISAFELDRFGRTRPTEKTWCSHGARIAAADAPGAVPIP